ncbi:uncharacterized protein BX664DRAFT_336496 [Halteromyces radiatus]|uniref:uncharacterized protein n=1 Tax=Halteromyces radiatus TaxID=101107 RepID=UPI00221ED3DA|nr:uncharacterized protein BX664DRAFT_336496 [Halteromyces radiatus]KAI8086681.1 hypothetical protein BX664DRAFT_336496 [Halteromyces radiatus]
MPPKQKPYNKKTKPLTSLERRAKKKKQELIQKATVKSQYYKALAKEHADDTPDYVKEIFEKTIDEDGNVVEYQSGTTKRKREEIDSDKVFDLDQEESSSDESDGSDQDQKTKKSTKDTTKSHKPNPFKTQLEEQQKKKQLNQQEREARQKEIEQKMSERKRYYQQRNKQRGKMLAKNKNGQPNLATQMEILIGRIKKD